MTSGSLMVATSLMRQMADHVSDLGAASVLSKTDHDAAREPLVVYTQEQSTGKPARVRVTAPRYVRAIRFQRGAVAKSAPRERKRRKAE